LVYNGVIIERWLF